MKWETNPSAPLSTDAT